MSKTDAKEILQDTLVEYIEDGGDVFVLVGSDESQITDFADSLEKLGFLQAAILVRRQLTQNAKLPYIPLPDDAR